MKYEILTVGDEFGVNFGVCALFLLLAVNVRGFVFEVGDARLSDMVAFSESDVHECLNNINGINNVKVQEDY